MGRHSKASRTEGRCLLRVFTEGMKWNLHNER
jgi:hypothetical protein